MDDDVGTQAINAIGYSHRWLVGMVTAAILLTAGVIAYNISREPSAVGGVVHFGRQPRGHNNSIVYPVNDLPPVGGVHHDRFQNCGIYTSFVETEKAVHSMEHGAVWISYDPGLAENEIAHLQRKVRGQEYLLLSPYPGQKSLIALTAWGVQLELSSAYDNRLDEFIARYRLGPTTPERGAACAGGFGEPLKSPIR